MRSSPNLAATIATLQIALDRAHNRIRELESTAAAMAERMGEATERADLAERYLSALLQAAQTESGATQSHADVSR